MVSRMTAVFEGRTNTAEQHGGALDRLTLSVSSLLFKSISWLRNGRTKQRVGANKRTCRSVMQLNGQRFLTREDEVQPAPASMYVHARDLMLESRRPKSSGRSGPACPRIFVSLSPRTARRLHVSWAAGLGCSGILPEEHEDARRLTRHWLPLDPSRRWRHETGSRKARDRDTSMIHPRPQHGSGQRSEHRRHGLDD